MTSAGGIALVTGGGRRLGRALAVALGREGMSVAVHYNFSADEAAETVRLIEERGGEAKAFQCDLAAPAGPEALLADIDSAYGKLHVLINSAAIMKRQALHDITVEDWEMTMSLNLRAPFFLARGAARLMSDGGSIVNIADLAAFENWPAYVPHAISKAAVIKMTEAMARVLAPRVRVNAIAPGAVLLPEGWSDESSERLADTTPLGRIGEPDDVVAAMLYLVNADFVTGETIIVDGGRHIRK
ncbi:MAG: SDR family oxidoreductase [Gemmatimonadaceae bacterium]